MFPFEGFYCTKSFQNPLVLCSKPFGKLKKFPFKGLFPFDGFPFNDFVLYCPLMVHTAQWGIFLKIIPYIKIHAFVVSQSRCFFGFFNH